MKEIKLNRKTAYEKLFRKGIRIAGRVIAAFIALLVVFEGISFPAHAEQTANGEIPTHIDKQGKAVTNTYIFETSTGLSTGEFIEYIMIKYTDESGNTKRHYIFPNTDTLGNGLKLAAGIGNDDNILQAMQTQFGYELVNDYKTKKALSSYNTDQFILTLPKAINVIFCKSSASTVLKKSARISVFSSLFVVAPNAS